MQDEPQDDHQEGARPESIAALRSVRVVLVEPEHPGNIGAVARSMANMGLGRLVLVAPRDFPSAEASARASGAKALLEGAEVTETLDEAIADCSLVIGTTARARQVDWPEEPPQEAMRRTIANAPGGTALVFGRESRGLTNAELERCRLITRIPVAASFSSMNLGSAVSVMLYELRRQALAPSPLGRGSPRAADAADAASPCTARELRHFYAHLEAVVDKADFGRGPATNRLRMLTRMFNRIEMRTAEVQLMRGLLRSIEAGLDAGAAR